jgi:hypothetical protein
MKQPFFASLHAYENQKTKNRSPQSIHAWTPHFSGRSKSFWIHLLPLDSTAALRSGFPPLGMVGTRLYDPKKKF